MWSEITADRCHNIAVDGYNVVAYQFGDGDETVLCLNGGPGLPCDYLREAHLPETARLSGDRLRPTGDRKIGPAG
jgi:hypothetical protein